MHNHQCKYCLNKFICDEPTVECFRRYIVCNECWFDHDLKYFVLFVALAVVAFVLSFILIGAFNL